MGSLPESRGREEHEQGQGKRIHPTLPIYANPAAGLVAYWDHTPRMEWQQVPGYYARQRASERPVDYLRFHENRWATAQTEFITEPMWRACINPDRKPILRARDLRVVIGVDAATKHDSAAIVAVTFDEVRQKLVVVNHAVWHPHAAEPIDLEATIETTVTEWSEAYDVIAVVYDPYQLVVVAKHLADAGLPIEEFPQTTDRLTAMGKTIWDLITNRNLETYDHERLQEHALNAVAVATPRGYRIAKEKTRKKIDLFIALAMAAHRCLREEGGGSLQIFIVDDVPTPPPTTAGEQAAAEQAQREFEAREAQELWNRPEVWRSM